MWIIVGRDILVPCSIQTHSTSSNLSIQSNVYVLIAFLLLKRTLGEGEAGRAENDRRYEAACGIRALLIYFVFSSIYNPYMSSKRYCFYFSNTHVNPALHLPPIFLYAFLYSFLYSSLLLHCSLLSTLESSTLYSLLSNPLLSTLYSRILSTLYSLLLSILAQTGSGLLIKECWKA